jgi:hypothetical protein
VLRVLGGEPAERVAEDLGVAQEQVATWERDFVRAGRRAISIDFDSLEAPTLDALLTVAQKGFPYHVLRDAQSCAGLFAARFYGKNDIIHLYRANVPEVELVDIDRPRIEIMQQMYPSRWTYVVADVFELVESYRRERRSFDVTICDCTTELASSILTDQLDDFLGITRQYLLVYGNEEMFSAWGASADPASLSGALSARHGSPVEVVDMPRRSSSRGGTYWVVVNASAADRQSPASS